MTAPSTQAAQAPYKPAGHEAESWNSPLHTLQERLEICAGAVKFERACGNNARKQRSELQTALAAHEAEVGRLMGDLRASEEEQLRLRKTLAHLIGTPEDPNNGWRGNAKTSDEHFACEYCGGEHLDCTLIEHKWNCPIPSARAALTNQGAKE